MTTRSEVVIATRGSELALWQSNWVAERLKAVHPGLSVRLHKVKTSGDRFQAASLQALGGKGAFTKEISEALLAGDADLAVHSLKDLPTEPTPGLRVWAYPERFDPRDAWLGRDGLRFGDLGPGQAVATGSLRRMAQIRHHHPGVTVEPVRGNLGTRLRKFEEGSMAGMILAMAGLVRLGLADRITAPLEEGEMLSAPGQGALALEGRDEAEADALLSPLDHGETRDRVSAERGLLAELEAGCQVPVAALAEVEGDDVFLKGLVASEDGTRLVRGERRGPRREAERLGRDLALELIGQGASEILAEVRGR
jgi:hydroxymethylbilane synthase